MISDFLALPILDRMLEDIKKIKMGILKGTCPKAKITPPIKKAATAPSMVSDLRRWAPHATEPASSDPMIQFNSHVSYSLNAWRRIIAIFESDMAFRTKILRRGAENAKTRRVYSKHIHILTMLIVCKRISIHCLYSVAIW